MKNDSAMISTSILTAIWEETHKDNIELITPFLKYLMYKYFKKGEPIDKELLIDKLQEEFSFNKFPHAILDVILKRMTKKEFLKRDNYVLYLIADFKDDYNLFKSRLENAKSSTNFSINALYEYLKRTSFPNITKDETRIALAEFIDNHGYNVYQNLLTTKSINPKKDFLNYCIGEYIYNESKIESEEFNRILKIIEGYMIANAIYMQIENDNKSTLKNVCCYLDAPFLLRVLGYKTKEENTSGQELFELLKKYRANICCFQHNFQEIINILVYYKKHIGTFQTSTLEYFDINNYNETQIDMVIDGLDDKFKELGIKIVDAPDYTEDKYKDVIDEKALEELLKEHSIIKMIPYNNENAIRNDVRSVCSINMLRKGKTTKKLENCTHIFVTTYYFLKYATKEVMKDIDDLEIGLVIDDLDLTTFLWFKDFSKNEDLPKLRLIENALAAIDPNPQIIEKANKCLEDIKRDGLIKDSNGVTQFLSTTYLKFSNDYIKLIENNPDNVTKENLGDYLMDKDLQLKKVKDELINTKERNMKNSLELELIKRNIIESAEKEIEKKSKRFNKIVKTIYYFVMITIIILCITSFILSLTVNSISIWSIISVILGLAGILDTTIPKAKYSYKLINYVSKKYLNYITNKENDKANKLMEHAN